MHAHERKTFPLVLPALFGAAGGLLNASLLWFQVPEKIADFKSVIFVCGALHGAALATCGVVGANLALRYPRLRVPIWLVVGYLAGWISWIPAHFLILEKPLIKALVWPLTLEKLSEAAWRPFQYFGLVGLLLAAALSIAPHAVRRSPLGLRGLGIAAGVLGSFWFWAMFEAHARVGYVAALHGTIWGLLVGAAVAWRTNRDTSPPPEVKMPDGRV